MGRELHEALEVKSKYADWIKNMCGYGFTEEVDYVTFSKNLENGGNHAKVHTYWTQKGRIFIYDLLKGKGILPNVERVA